MKLMLNCVFYITLLQALLISAKLPDFITPDILAMAQSDKDRCMAEHGTTEDLIDDVNDNQRVVNDRKITCYMHCLFDAFSMIDDDGSLEADMLGELLPADIASKQLPILKSCLSQPGADLCDKVYNIATCTLNKGGMWFAF